jgi:hypothetical protein
VKTVLRLSAAAIAVVWFTSFGAQKASAWYIDIWDLEPNGFVSPNRRQLDLKFGSLGVGTDPRQHTVADVVVYQPDTGAVAVGRWVSAGQAPVNLWTRAHALGRSPRFEEGYVIVHTLATHFEGNLVIGTREWQSVVYLQPDD